MPLHPLGAPAHAKHPSSRPKRANSEILSTRAWVQYILDFCNSAVSKDAPLPISWGENLTPGERDVLARRLKCAGLTKDAEPRLRTPKDLDTLWHELRRRKSIDKVSGDPVFETRYAYGHNTPSQEVQDLFALIVPNSSKLFLQPPEPFDPFLYHALDFQNVLTGRVLLLRVIAPWEVKSAGDALVVHEDNGEQFEIDAALGDDERKSHAPLDFQTRATLCGEVVEAVACGVFPAEASEGSGRLSAIDRVLSWDSKVRVDLGSSGFTYATRSLTDSLTAYRLATVLAGDPQDRQTDCKRAAAIWLHAALDALIHHPDFGENDKKAFYRPPRSKQSALEDVLTKSGCWYPEIP